MFRRVVAFGRIRRSVWTNLAGAVAPPGHHGHRELVGKDEINADENLRQRAGKVTNPVVVLHLVTTQVCRLLSLLQISLIYDGAISGGEITRGARKRSRNKRHLNEQQVQKLFLHCLFTKK
jgi:hypothetical protein